MSCTGGHSTDPEKTSKSLLDTTIGVAGQFISFASMKPTWQIHHMDAQRSSVNGDTLFSDSYLSALQCTVAIYSDVSASLTKAGSMHSIFLSNLLMLDRQILDSTQIDPRSKADSGWVYNVLPKPGKTGYAGKAVLASKGRRGFYVKVGVPEDSLPSWKARIDSLVLGLRFE